MLLTPQVPCHVRRCARFTSHGCHNTAHVIWSASTQRARTCWAPAGVMQQQQQQHARTTVMAAQQPIGGSYVPESTRMQGPQPFRTLPVLNIQLGPSPSDPTTPLSLQMEVVIPQSSSPCPVVVFTPGFLLNSSLYRSYAAHLASWGYTVVLWDLSDVLDDTLTCAYMKQVIDTCQRDPRVQQHCDISRLLLMGHSRGAKLSCLIAEQDRRVQGLALVDPVDNSSFGPRGVGYPSALPALRSRPLPVLVIGAALNTDVVPPEANWKQFRAAAAAGGSLVWELVLKGSSHLQFLDKQLPLFAMFSNNGPTPDAIVRQVTQASMVTFTQLAVCPAAAYTGSQIKGLLTLESQALSQLAPLDYALHNVERLQTAAAAYQAQTASTTGSNSSSQYRPYASSSSSKASSPGPSGNRPKPVQASYSQLMGMRVGELKRLLQEHGVESSDCFEKEELVKRVLQRCTLAT